jgi:uncharacterized delta-60 repeat protein
MKVRSNRGWRFAAAPAVVAGAATAVLAAAGDLDTTFGTGGIAQSSLTWGAAWGAAVQADGKVLTCGWDMSGSSVSTWRIERRNADGSMDSGYGTGGAVVPFAGAAGRALDVALDGDGHAVVVGQTTVTTTGKGGKTTTQPLATVARFTPSGALDASFGTGGRTTISVSGANLTVASAVAIQPDGKIVVAGGAQLPPTRGNQPAQYAILVARLDANGSLDASFGSGGVRVNDLTSVDDTVWRHAVALQSSGKIVVGSTTATGASPWRITRYLANGSIDAAFGTLTASESLRGVAVDGSDRIVATGVHGAASGGTDMLVRRYGVDGALDMSFGSGGSTVVAVTYASEPWYEPVFLADGKIVFSGAIQPYAPTSGATQHVTVRLTADGALDSTYGSGGITSSIALGDQANTPGGIALAPGGKLVVVGSAASSGTPSTSNWYAARQLGD